jgi:selenide,water dikinase
VLRHLPSVVHPNVLVDAASRDDAAVYRLTPDRAIVATVDFFTPIVDDPRDWGAIAAANALSDIYAMGAAPLFALNLVGWPRGVLSYEILGEVIQGASEVAAEAECLMLGGHSVDDPEPKFGMCVIGEVHPDRLLTNAGARPGDRLVLTKPLGTGILSTALKRELIDDSAMAPAVRSMRALNRGAARAALAHGVTTATDVTGFGLWGHLENILNASGVGAELSFDALPLLPRARELADQGVVPGGTERNYAAAEKVDWDPQLTQGERYLTVDAQTSGGVLLAVAPGRRGAGLLDLESNGTLAAATIGTLNTHQGQLRVTR